MKIGRNDPCPCGSGIKYKKCCLNIRLYGHTLNLKGQKGEEFVHNLANHTFLQDWCYPNPCLPNGKEICDLLVLFDNIAIIWQIKNPKLHSGKYKESEVKRNIEQLLTAKNRLICGKVPIVVENPRRSQETINPSDIKKVFLISALVGEPEEHFSFFEIIEDAPIHIFNREFVELSLKELDTIVDFVHYLEETERAFSASKKITVNGGEKEILATYLSNERSLATFDKYDTILVEEGCWDKLIRRPEFIKKKEEDKISYQWDSILDWAHTAGVDYEIIARELARPNRFYRRCLAKAYTDARLRAHNEKTKDVFRRMTEVENTTYCFLMIDEKISREVRKNMLQLMCYIARGIVTKNSNVIGIATEKAITPTCSYDFCYLNYPKWTNENKKEAARLQKETGIFTDTKYLHQHEEEYPTN
ncbi:MAG: SEC-C metal-binding domain-containing protein [Candidatus Altiarchaeota archaeon]|nr:SEC-C metal-binding domain-containing protein [Candidatus Altiarchaeota archaeon]